MLNKTWDSLHISCKLSSNNHMDQIEDQYKFFATITDRKLNESKVMKFDSAEFRLYQLEPGTQYSIELYAENKIGAGPPITLLADTQKQAEKRTAESKIALQSGGVAGPALEVVVLGVLAGVMAVLSCAAGLVVVVVRHARRQHNTSDRKYSPVLDCQPGSKRASTGSGHTSLDADSESQLQNSLQTKCFISGLQSAGLLRSKGLVIDSNKTNSEHQRDPGGAFKSELEDQNLQHGPIASNHSSFLRLHGSDKVQIEQKIYNIKI